LIDRALTDQREPVIIDTDGWVGDEYAISYKHRLIDNIIPDAIVVIGNELYSIFSKYENIGIKVYGLKTPSVRRIRNREERRMLRRDKYREYLENAKQVKVSLDKVVVTGHPIFHGRSIESFEGIDQSILGKIVYASRTFDTLYIIANSPIKNEEIEYLKKTLNVSKIRIYPQNFEKNLYVAVSNGVEDYPGLIDRVDFINREMVLKTFFNGDIKFVRVSSIRLLEDYSEQMI